MDNVYKKSGFLNLVYKIKNMFNKRDGNTISNKLSDCEPESLIGILNDINEFKDFNDAFNTMEFDLKKQRLKYPVLRFVKNYRDNDKKDIRNGLKAMYDGVSRKVLEDVKNYYDQDVAN
ncbi:MAG: hypothetical protein ABF289_18905 [Clostridiales bacterium]